ncbi:MAG: hypothetical protein A3B99_04610 [Candidatus Yanofskybacteria bacterium RIFCSPHIGHO2_02_FULL_44_12b]|uniref:Uncharacterized protein n=1 Tax=Candidatus Yanofskybacteria bacterium RIFCSPLOWO2_01_FULL_44_22 TaxID=1802697 RepID=A0A1F8GM06_9BACT|nr:MAG: hypothetical protein A3B99_04610 [Candidatus Yanofskybacteria bacterium RIFCSPHIGHO2_02_FULL_44_12b]OGN25738.1 MAG: hypothetical protein A2925_00950 [Candidatus Yanofskybacteria bacterium RIFCSPLOWO2_01_FULL_44_22]
MKKYIYISCFIVLGLILQQFIHTIVEIWYIELLTINFDAYGFGWSWDTWFLVHHIGSVILLIAGILTGYFGGRYFWPKLYDENGKVRFPKPWRI